MTGSDGVDGISVFSDDDKLKVLGELLGNRSSRDIIRLLICRECYANDIATTLNMRSNLVVHHLKKMESIGLVEVREGRLTRKGQTHRFFRIRPGILVLPEPAEGGSLLKRLAGGVVKFAAVGAAAALSYFLVDALRATEGIVPQTKPLDPLVYALVVAVAGLAVLYYKKRTR